MGGSHVHQAALNDACPHSRLSCASNDHRWTFLDERKEKCPWPEIRLEPSAALGGSSLSLLGEKGLGIGAQLIDQGSHLTYTANAPTNCGIRAQSPRQILPLLPLERSAIFGMLVGRGCADVRACVSTRTRHVNSSFAAGLQYSLRIRCLGLMTARVCNNLIHNRIHHLAPACLEMVSFVQATHPSRAQESALPNWCTWCTRTSACATAGDYRWWRTRHLLIYGDVYECHDVEGELMQMKHNVFETPNKADAPAHGIRKTPEAVSVFVVSCVDQNALWSFVADLGLLRRFSLQASCP